MEFISEENYGLDFRQGNLIDDLMKKIENGSLNLIPKNIRNEIKEYINQELFVIFINFY